MRDPAAPGAIASDDPILATDALVRRMVRTILPILLLMIALPGVGTWVLYFTVARPLPASLGGVGTAVLLVAMIGSILWAPSRAAAYKSLLKDGGLRVIYPVLAATVVYALYFGLIAARLVRMLFDTGSDYAILPLGFFTYCVMLVSWLTKLPFDVALKIYDDGSKPAS